MLNVDGEQQYSQRPPERRAISARSFFDTYSDNVGSLDLQLFHQGRKGNAAQLGEFDQQGKALRGAGFGLRDEFMQFVLLVVC